MGTQGRFLVGSTLTFIVFAIFISWLIEFSVISTQHQQLQEAAQVGVVYGSRCHCSSDQIENFIRNTSDYPIDLHGSDVRVSILTGLHNACESNGMGVHITYDHPVFAPLISRVVENKFVPVDVYSYSYELNQDCQ